MSHSVVALGLLLAIGLGALGSIVGGKITLLLVAGALPLPVILRDYRIGVALMVLLLPASTMLPPIRGLNLLNFLTIATLGSFMLKKVFSREDYVPLPKLFVFGFILPATMAIIVAWPHIPEGARNYYLLPKAALIYEPVSYLLSRYLKPIFYFFSFAFLLANALKDSERPERFLLLLAASTIVPCLAVFYSVWAYPGSLADVSRDREFMAGRGMHANEFGMLLALASGPLLFMIGKFASRWSNWFMAACFGLVTVGLLFTFSRGGLLAYLIVLGGFLVLSKRIKVIFITIGLAAVGLLFAPDAVQERFSTGLRADAIQDASNVQHDDLTAGRVHGWTLLAPEVLESPLIGRGLGSTQWSAAVAQGRYRANHPHNIYLELLMDVGVIGFIMFAMFYFRIARRFKELAYDQSVPEPMRAFYQGSRWAFLGMLAMAATTAYYMPNPAQTYFWFACGALILRWKPAVLPQALSHRAMQRHSAAVPRPQFNRQRRQRPAAR